jgi:hypothetical protein
MMVAMSSLHTNSVRLVIQRVQDGTKSHYRVAVYPGPRGATLHAKFSSRDDLSQRLRAAIPDFDDKRLVGTSEASEILFAELTELSDAQLSSLGLRY